MITIGRPVSLHSVGDDFLRKIKIWLGHRSCLKYYNDVINPLLKVCALCKYLERLWLCDYDI